MKRMILLLVLRNMRTDWKRVLVTTVSIAGGCMLMMIGFTLRYGITGVPDRQFGGIQTYEAEVFYKTDENENAEAEIAAVLKQNGLQHIKVQKESGVFEVDRTLDALTLIVAEKGSQEGYFALRSINSGELTLWKLSSHQQEKTLHAPNLLILALLRPQRLRLRPNRLPT